MVRALLGPLVRHPVHRRLLAPAIGVGVAAGLGLRLLGELRERSVVDGVQQVVLLLAMTTVVAVIDPAGPIADATPTPLRHRRGLRIALSLLAVAVGWILALGGLPSASRPPVPSVSADLAVLCAVVLGVAAVEVRLLRRLTDPIGAAVGVAMAWAALWFLQPAWSPFEPSPGDRRGLVVLGAAALVALGLASADPARPTLPRRVRPRCGTGPTPPVRRRGSAARRRPVAPE